MINFHLKTPKAKRSTIRMMIWFRGVRYRLTTGVSVEVSRWNTRTQRIRQIADDISAPLENEELDKVHAAAVRTIAKFKSKREAPTAREFRDMFEVEYKGKPKPKDKPIPSFTKYMATYIERYRSMKSYNTTRSITTIYNKLIAYEKETRTKITFKGIDMVLYAKLAAYFASQGHRDSYFATAIKVIKQVYREAREVDRIHSFDAIAAKGFSSSSREVDNIYLNEDELRAINELPLSMEMLRSHYPDSRDSDLLRKVECLRTSRAFFMIGAYTGLRVSDFTRLGSADISDRIRIRTRKTDQEVVIPIHPIVRAVLNSSINLSAPPSAQRLNDSIKELAQLAGLTKEVYIRRRVGGSAEVEVKQQWQLVTNHTARRSFATNAYKAGIPSIAIMKITGHTKESTFLKYIKMEGEENAQTLEQHPFFKG